MTIKVKIKPDFKATLRFNDRREMDFFRFIMIRLRDDPAKNHPQISVKDPNGKEAPGLPVMKPAIVNPQQAQMTEQPIAVQAKSIEIQVKPEIKCYTKADLIVGEKLICPDCKYNNKENSTCQRGQPSEDYYRDFNGNILGCPEGERRTSA